MEKIQLLKFRAFTIQIKIFFIWKKAQATRPANHSTKPRNNNKKILSSIILTIQVGKIENTKKIYVKSKKSIIKQKSKNQPMMFHPQLPVNSLLSN
jgi:hypothetical protein